jgi:hypothetical protein
MQHATRLVAYVQEVSGDIVEAFVERVTLPQVRAEHRPPLAACHAGHITRDLHRTVSMHRAACDMQRTTCGMQRSCSVQSATCSIQHTEPTSNIPHATYSATYTIPTGTHCVEYRQLYTERVQRTTKRCTDYGSRRGTHLHWVRWDCAQSIGGSRSSVAWPAMTGGSQMHSSLSARITLNAATT